MLEDAVLIYANLAACELSYHNPGPNVRTCVRRRTRRRAPEPSPFLGAERD